MGLYGILVVTTAPAGTTAGTAYPGVTYNADVPLLLSEIDPVQNNAVSTAVSTPGFSETKVWSGQAGQCGDPMRAANVLNTCYPPAVNYSPRYYLVNGVAFNKTSPATSLFAAAPASGVTGNVLVRIVNAGLRMHVPSIVGSLTTPSGRANRRDCGCGPGLQPGGRRRQSSAGCDPRAERSVHGSGQDLRCDDQCTCRHDGASVFRSSVEPFGERDCA